VATDFTLGNINRRGSSLESGYLLGGCVAPDPRDATTGRAARDAKPKAGIERGLFARTAEGAPEERPEVTGPEGSCREGVVPQWKAEGTYVDTDQSDGRPWEGRNHFVKRA